MFKDRRNFARLPDGREAESARGRKLSSNDSEFIR